MTEVRPGVSIYVAGLELTPIERVSVWVDCRSGTLTAVVSKSPVEIQIRSDDGTRTLDLEGHDRSEETARHSE